MASSHVHECVRSCADQNDEDEKDERSECAEQEDPEADVVQDYDRAEDERCGSRPVDQWRVRGAHHEYQ
ncbi:MAG: hypothetical protein MK052_01365 [Alphaproteobacteria bacterium]|nr:hypothetical protein [Alphaproteobacteria bacterium]